MKRKLALAGLILMLALYAGVRIYMIQTMPPENKAKMVSWVRESPAWQFYGLMGLASIPVLIAGYIVINQKRWSQAATSGSLQNAQKVATSLWRVEHTSLQLAEELRRIQSLGIPVESEGLKSAQKVENDNAVVVQFRHFSFSGRTLRLPVREGHPDIARFRSLTSGDVVEFEPLDKGLECALEHELCGYLRIKEVRST